MLKYSSKEKFIKILSIPKNSLTVQTEFRSEYRTCFCGGGI